MSPKQNLFYALGEIAYAIATADGAIQQQEKKAFHEILEKEFKKQEWDSDYSEIIFQILEKDRTDLQTAYNWSMKEIKANSEHLSSNLKTKFINVIKKVAEAFPPVTKEERGVIYKFIKELESVRPAHQL